MFNHSLSITPIPDKGFAKAVKEEKKPEVKKVRRRKKDESNIETGKKVSRRKNK